MVGIVESPLSSPKASMFSDIGVSDAARILGVSVSTLKRLCDEGLVASTRTPGGHRRFDRSEMELVGQRLFGNACRYLDEVHEDVGAKFQFVLLSGHVAGAAELIKKQLGNYGNLPRVLDYVFLPALMSLSTKVESVVQLRLAEQTASDLLDRVALQFPLNAVTSPRCIGVAADASTTDLASKLVETALRGMGIYGLNLGAADTSFHLTEMAKELGVQSVWLAILNEDSLSPLATLRQSVAEALPDSIQVAIYSAHHLTSGRSIHTIAGCFSSLDQLSCYLGQSKSTFE